MRGEGQRGDMCGERKGEGGGQHEEALRLPRGNTGKPPSCPATSAPTTSPAAVAPASAATAAMPRTAAVLALMPVSAPMLALERTCVPPPPPHLSLCIVEEPRELVLRA